LSAKLVPTFEDRGVSHDQCGGSPKAVTTDKSTITEKPFVAVFSVWSVQRLYKEVTGRKKIGRGSQMGAWH
jgi:hypothetical protein